MKVFRFLKMCYQVLLQGVSMNNQKCKVRPKIVDINTNSPMFYPFSIKMK